MFVHYRKTELFFLWLNSDSRNEIFTPFLTVITTPRLLVSVIIKRKVVPPNARHEGVCGNEGIAPLIFNAGVRRE